MAELVGVLVGQYFLLECLRREGIAEAYRARPIMQGGDDVMLRLFQPPFPDPAEFREHFADEAEKVLRCQHEHIQPLLEFGAGDGLLYSVTPLTDEEALEQFLARQPGRLLPLSQVVQIITRLCAALQYVHQQGIVHGNVQPASIVMPDQEQVQLTHFSMRRAYQDGDAVVSQIDEGNAAYRAPEQTLGMLCPASDIYALGVLLYRLLGGCLPYDGESPGEIALKHAEEPIPSLRVLRPEVPEAVELVVRVALAKKPDARFPTPAALAQALLYAVGPGASPIGPTMNRGATVDPRFIVRSIRPRRRTILNPRLGWIPSTFALLLLLLALASTLLFAFTPLQQADVETWLLRNGNHFVLPESMSTRTVSATAVTFAVPPKTPTAVSSSTSNRYVTPTPTTGQSHMYVTPTPMTGQSHMYVTPTPTTGQSQTPIASPTVGSNPLVEPAPTASPQFCTSGTLSIDGSSDLEPALQQMSNEYRSLCPDLTIALSGNGILPALNSLQQGQLDIAASDVMVRHAQHLTDHLAGALLYAVVVSPDVQLSGLSSAELQGIYQGQITNWAQVGGPDEAIRVVRRPVRDPVNAIFRAFVLGGVAEHVKGRRMRAVQGHLAVETVAQLQGAISFVPLAEAEGAGVNVLSIDGTAPGVQGLLQGNYAFWSVEHLYTQGEGTLQSQAYIRFLNTEQEASTMARFGVVPIGMLPASIVASHLSGPTQ